MEAPQNKAREQFAAIVDKALADLDALPIAFPLADVDCLWVSAVVQLQTQLYQARRDLRVAIAKATGTP